MGLFSRPSRGGTGERGSATRFFFATDLHSSEVCFRKLLATPKAYGVDTVIMGGDCTGKMLVPLVELAGHPGGYRVVWGGDSIDARTPEEVEEQVKRLRYSGLYPVRLTQEEAERLHGDPALLHELFSRQMLDTVAGWTALAEERLAPTGTHVVMTPGNDDEFEV